MAWEHTVVKPRTTYFDTLEIDDYIGVLTIINSLDEDLTIDAQFSQGLIQQAYEDFGPDQSTHYEFEVPIVVAFEKVEQS